MVNAEKSLSSIGVLSARIPASHHAGSAGDSHAGPWRIQSGSWGAAGHGGHVGVRFVPPVGSPSGLPEILPHKAQACVGTEVSSDRVQPCRVEHVRRPSRRRAEIPTTRGRTEQSLRSLSYSSLTLCCVAPRLARLRGHAAPCLIVRDGSATMIVKRDIPSNLTSTDVPEVYRFDREGHDGSRLSLPTMSRIGPMLS
jgi:hypothetical protein